MNQIILLCDLSGSMGNGAFEGKSRIEVVRRAVSGMREKHPGAKVVCFNEDVWLTHNLDMEEPGGCTDLARALAFVQKLNPGHTVIISDGHPDDTEAAMQEAMKTPGVISMIYAGVDEDTEAIAFMKRLVRIGAGVGIVDNIDLPTSNLLDSIEKVLALPAPE